MTGERKSETITAVIQGVRYEKVVFFDQCYLVVEKRKEWSKPVVTAWSSITLVMRQVRMSRAAGFELADWAVAHVVD